MIQGYQPPQLLIRQALQSVDSSSRERLSALVIGPQYVWPDPEEDTITRVAVAADDITYSLNYTTDDAEIVTTLAGGYRVDASSVRVFIEGAEYRLHSDTNKAATTSLSSPNQLRMDADILRVVGAGTLDSTFDGRNIQLGDTVSVTESVSTRSVKRKVVGFLGELSAPVFADTANQVSNVITSTAQALTKVSGPGNVTTITGGAGLVYLATDAVIEAHMVEGYKFTDANGELRSGTKAKLKVVSYAAGLGTGTLIVSYEDGLTPAVVAPFAFAGGVLTIALGTALPRIQGGANILVTYVAGHSPTVGDEFVVTSRIAFTALDEDFLTVAFVTAPEKDNKFYVKVKQGNGPNTDGSVILTIYDKLGLVPATDITNGYDVAFALPFGSTSVSILSGDAPSTLPQKGWRTGDVYYVNYTAPAASTTAYDGVILDGPVAVGGSLEQTLAVNFLRSAAGEVTASDFIDGILPMTLDADAGTVLLENTIAWTKYVDAFTTGSKYRTIVANSEADSVVYLTWRASKIPLASEAVISIGSISDLAQLGKLDLRNDLAFAVFAALSGAKGKTVYALRTAGPEVVDFTEALGKVEHQDYTYALAPVTSNKFIGKLVASHCEEMSSEDVQNFRRSYFGVDSPGDYIIAQEVTPGGDPYTATIHAYSGGNLRVTFVETIDLNAMGVTAGDYIVIAGATYTIASVLTSGDELILKTGPEFQILSPEAVVVWRKDTAESQASYVENVAGYINSRRCAVIWSEGAQTFDANGNISNVPMRYVAAFIAGLRSATLPWLGMSRAPVSFVTGASPMYLKYSKTLLNRMASNGVFIITQTIEEGPVFVRHQLTSDVSAGSLVYEDSIGTNLDDLSFQFKDSFEPLIGITNVTQETVRVMEQRGSNILVDARSSQTDPLIGPQVIQFFDELDVPGQLTVRIHPRFKDRILIRAKVELPLPNNSTIVELTAVSGITL